MNEEIEKLLKQLAAGEVVYEGPKVGPTPNQIDLTPGFTLEQSSTISVPYMDEDGEWTKRSLPLVIADLQDKGEMSMLNIIYTEQLADQKERLNAHVVTPIGDDNGKFEVGDITGAQDLDAFGESMKIQDVRESAPSENGTYTLEDSPIKGDAVVYVNNLAVPSVEFGATDGVDGNVSFTFSEDQPEIDAKIAVYGNSIDGTGPLKKHIAGCDEAIAQIADNSTSTEEEFEGYEAAQKEAMDVRKEKLGKLEDSLQEANDQLSEAHESFDNATNENAIKEAFDQVKSKMQDVYSLQADKAQIEADIKAIETALDDALKTYKKYEDGSNEATANAADAKSESQERLDNLEKWIDGENGGAA